MVATSASRDASNREAFFAMVRDTLGVDAEVISGDEEANWTLSVGLAQFRSLHAVQWNLVTAATVVTMAPIVVVFFFAQKAFVQGVTLTGVKG